MLDSKVSLSRVIRTTAELRASRAISIASGEAYHLILLSTSRIHRFSAAITKSGKQSSIEVNLIQGRYVVWIDPSLVDGTQAKKSPTSCAGA